MRSFGFAGFGSAAAFASASAAASAPPASRRYTTQMTTAKATSMAALSSSIWLMPTISVDQARHAGVRTTRRRRAMPTRAKSRLPCSSV